MQQANSPLATNPETLDPASDPTSSAGRALSRKHHKGPNGTASSARNPSISLKPGEVQTALTADEPPSDKNPKRQRAESDTSHDAEEGEITTPLIDNTIPQSPPQDPLTINTYDPLSSEDPSHPHHDPPNDIDTPLTLTPKATPLPPPAGEAAQHAFNRLHAFNGAMNEAYDPGTQEPLDGFEEATNEDEEMPSDDEWEMLDEEAERMQERVRGLRKRLNDENDEEDEARQEEEEALPAARWVPRPRQDFPPIYGEAPTFAYSNLNPAQRDAVMAEDDAHNLMVMVEGENSWAHPKCNEIAGVIADEICAFLDIEDVDISPALARNPPQHHNDPPWVYYVRDLNIEQAIILEEQQVLASRRIQIHIFPTIFLGSSGYGGTIEGLVPTNLRNFTDTKRNILTRDLAEVLFAHKGFYDAVMTYSIDSQAPNSDAIPAWQHDQCVRSFLRTEFQVTVLPVKNAWGILAPAVNLYFLLATRKDIHRRSILAQLRTIEFSTTRFGTGTYSIGWKCHACRAVDHPTGLCAFKSVPRWNEIVNPPPAPPAAPNQHTNLNNIPRGLARGRGRGQNPARGQNPGRGQNGGRGHTRGQPTRGARGARGVL